jgi:hypothetical protein
MASGRLATAAKDLGIAVARLVPTGVAREDGVTTTDG